MSRETRFNILGCHVLWWLFGFFVLGGVILMCVLLSLTVNKKVQQNEIGVVWNSYTMEIKNIYDQGTYTLDVGDNLETYIATVQYMDYTNLPCYTKDKLQITLDTQTQYTYIRDKLIPIMYRQYGNQGALMEYFDAAIKSAIYSTCVLFTSQDCYNNRQLIETAMLTNITNVVKNADIGIDVNLFVLRDIDFPTAFSNTIANIQAATQQIQTQLVTRQAELILANTSLIQAKQTAQQIMIQAENSAKLILQQANATANVIITQLHQQALSFKLIKDSLELNASGLISFLKSEFIRTAQHPFISIAN